ncbi:MAG: acyl-CoA dehydrogenase C-terminal domain-containing protein [Beijerinckiaceae bacterium]
MPTYKAPVADTMFLLTDVFPIENYRNLPQFAEASLDLVEAVLNEGGKFAEEVLQPLNLSGDAEGCRRHPDGSVSTPKGFKGAYKSFVEAGWSSVTGDPEFGGQGLPKTVGLVLDEYLIAANLSFTMYHGLTHGATEALHAHASDEIKQRYLHKMISGEWTGTMNLTEPHCGTDLGLIKTKATRRADGSFSLSGQKIFISAGEHDLADNIIHLVLARIEGAPAGVKGISLFVVPKVLVGDNGSLGVGNNVACGSIEHKMGIHGNSTCVMNYDDAQGWLIGEENRGLNAMFVMMNTERLMVAMQGLAQSEVAYQNAAAYAKERLQGRALTGAKQPSKSADPLIVHPDIRRMLLEIRSFNEAARALAIWIALALDEAEGAPDDKTREAANDRIGLLTPVAKAYFTDMGFENAVKAQQVLGGHGYIHEWGMDQFVRDARITMIYEGANGVQALDLVGRKLPMNGGRAVAALISEIDDYLAENASDPKLSPYLSALEKSLGLLKQASAWIAKHAPANPDNAGAASVDYLRLFALTSLSYMWARVAKSVLARQAAGSSNPALDAKLTLGVFFNERVLPQANTHFACLTTGADCVMALSDEMF